MWEPIFLRPSASLVPCSMSGEFRYNQYPVSIQLAVELHTPLRLHLGILYYKLQFPKHIIQNELINS